MRYPFRTVHRRWLPAFAAAGLLSAFLQAILPGLLGMVIALALSLVVWIVLFRLASEIPLSASEGAASAPAFRDMDSADGLAIKHIALWLFFTMLLGALAANLGYAAVAAGSLAALIVLPAATVILTLSNSMTDALAPAYLGTSAEPE
ncbi:MAG: hypothetical protein RQ741_06545 [Wenzhouxiangellaceae bacterium]|nr:hypothetical protein [Wenzhouxiangellaceae bacterium]